MARRASFARRRRCRQTIVDGYPRQVWWNADGETIVESYTITDMAHGTPLGIGDNDEHYGAQGAFLIEAGISSSYHIANFFGLTERIHQPKENSKEIAKETSKDIPKEVSVAASAPTRTPDIATVLRPLATLNGVPQAARRTAARRDRCRWRHYPRTDGRGAHEIGPAAR